MDRLVLRGAVIGFAPEHIIAETHAGGILQEEEDGFDDGLVDGDVSVLLPLSGVTGLLLENGEAVLECEIVIDEIGKSKHPQVADSQSEVDANNEEHIVPIPLILD